jgi:DNA-binding response OmpR family regulator
VTLEPTPALAGLRILVVEDEMLVSLLIEDTLADEQCIVVGPFDRVPTGLAAAESETIDAAVLDVNLAGEKVYPIAEALAARGIPFLLLSGYGQSAAPSEHADWPVCNKPFNPEKLVAQLAQILGRDRVSE